MGVVYASDMALVRSTLEAVAKRLNDAWGVPDRRPTVFMTEFGNHAVQYDVGIWIADPWEQRPRRSEMHEAIWHALQEQGIVIAFPQVDVHLDPPVAAGLARIGARRSRASPLEPRIVARRLEAISFAGEAQRRGHT